MKQATAGITLIELLVTLGLLAIVLTMGVPAFASLQRDARVANVHHLLTSSLALARITAVSRGKPVTVCPSSNGTNCRTDTVWEDGWIVFIDPLRTGNPASEAAIVQRLDPIGPGLALRSTAARRRVRFSPSGWSSGSNLSVRLCSAKDQRHLGSVIVNNAGRPRSERYQQVPCPYAL